MKRTLVLALACALVGSAHAQLWNNSTVNSGGLVTHPGAGPGGLHVSMSDPLLNTAGSNVLQQTTNPHFRVADDFTVGGPGWIVSNIDVYAYQTGAVTPTWTGANLNLWSGRPGDAGAAIVSSYSIANMAAAITNTGILRTFNGVTQDTNRRIFSVRFNTSNVVLNPGTYWIDWQIVGGASAWAPYVMRPDPLGGNSTITVFGNGRQMAAGPIWQDLLAAPGAETPFLVHGEAVPEPGTMLALGAGLAAIAARRRRRKA